MHEGTTATNVLTTPALIRRAILLLLLAVGLGLTGYFFGFTMNQAVAASVFFATIMGTLLFWNLRLAVAFIGVAVLVLTHSLDLPGLVKATSLPVILFLAGMMVIVGALRDTGFFTWVVQSIVAMPRITARKFIAVTAVASALLACLVDEVTSIIFISALVFQVCDRLKLNPAPYLITCVLCTNVGSAGTMMGNPVGIYIGAQAGLTFMDFIVWAFPVMLLALAATLAVTLHWYRHELDLFDERLADRLSRDLSLAPIVDVPHRQGVALLTVTFLMIASHHQLEHWLGLATNSVLLITPLAVAGGVMIWRHRRARFYIEREVDWWTLLFFMLLFAVAGTLEHVGLTQMMARGFTSIFGGKLNTLIPLIISTTSLGSAFVDNVVFVAAFSPVIRSLSDSIFGMPLWWALLFGACFGGNITLIGSTANIVALGLLERHSHVHITFWQWFKVGALSAVVSAAVAWGALIVTTPLMARYAGTRDATLSGTTMGTTWSVRIADTAPDRQLLRRLDADIKATLDELSRQMSPWREDSEITAFNQAGANQPITISEDFQEVMRQALFIAELTGGAFDPTVGALVNLWGFGPDGRQAAAPNAEQIAAARAHTGWQHLTLHRNGKLSKKIPELRLDLNAIAKGYGVDKITQLVRDAGFHHFLVDIGGETRVVGLNARREPWRMGVLHPNVPNKTYRVVHMTDRPALATSGDYRNHYRDESGKDIAHIVDPRTAAPVQHNTASVTILAPDCMTADALATALFVLGHDEGLPLLKKHFPEADALFILRTEDNGLQPVASAPDIFEELD